MATGINTLKKWFSTGLKPTQEQFWNWIDSFWHKDDKIPVDSIDGIDKILENKAETTAVDAKANADASGLGDDNVAKWKEALGVGEVPDNMATIDKDGEQGNVYHKHQITELLESSGKNIGNSDLETTSTRTFTQAHIYTHNTSGYHYYITGLANKSADPTFNLLLAQNSNGQTAVSNGKAVLESLMASLPSVKDARTGNYDLNFSSQIVYNPNTKQIAVSDRPQVVTNFNVPSQINIHYSSSIANTNYTPSSNTPQDIRDTFEMIKRLESSYDFTLTTDGMWLEKTIPNEKIAPYSTWRVPTPIKTNTGIAGLVHTKPYTVPPELHNNLIFKGNVADIDSMWSLYLNKEFPSDKDWIFRLRVHGNKTDYLMAFGGYMGFAKDLSGRYSPFNKMNDWGLKEEYVHIMGDLGKNTFLRHPDRFFYYMYFVKKGSKLSLFIHNYHTGYTLLNTVDYNAETMRYFRMGIPISGGLPEKYEHQFIDVGYWIEP